MHSQCLRYRPAGLPGFRDLPLLILAVEHGADAVRVLGAQLHRTNTESRCARPGPHTPAPQGPVPRLLPAVPAAPGAGGGASAARGSPAGGCSWSVHGLFMACSWPAPPRSRRRRHFPRASLPCGAARGEMPAARGCGPCSGVQVKFTSLRRCRSSLGAIPGPGRVTAVTT